MAWEREVSDVDLGLVAKKLRVEDQKHPRPALAKTYPTAEKKTCCFNLECLHLL